MGTTVSGISDVNNVMYASWLGMFSSYEGVIVSALSACSCSYHCSAKVILGNITLIEKDGERRCVAVHQFSYVMSVVTIRAV